MNQYKLAIVIPSYNCSAYIGEMLDSIIANTFTNWRCFVVDDKSTDNTLELLRTYHNNDDRIIYKVRDRDPKGAQTCRNIGMELSDGAEYVIWFDADDIIAPYCLEQRVRYMENHPQLDFGVFPAKTFKKEISELDDSTSFYGYQITDDTLKAILDRTLPMVGWTNIYKRISVLEFNLEWDTNIMSLQDSDWNIQAIVKGCKFDYAVSEGAKVDYYYRIGTGGVSNKISSTKHGLSHLYYLQKLTYTIEFHFPLKYAMELQSYVLWIEKKIKDDRKLFLRFMMGRWLLLHPWLWIRIAILHHYGGRYEDILFPRCFQNEKAIMVSYSDIMNKIRTGQKL